MILFYIHHQFGYFMVKKEPPSFRRPKGTERLGGTTPINCNPFAAHSITINASVTLHFHAVAPRQVLYTSCKDLTPYGLLSVARPVYTIPLHRRQ